MHFNSSPTCFDPLAKDFIRHLLVLDPKTRYTAEQALKHPFIVKHCGVTDITKLMKSLDVKDDDEPTPSNNLAPGIHANLTKVISSKNLKVRPFF